MWQADASNSPVRIAMAITRYVIIIAVSEDATKVVLLTKNRGPEYLVGKTTFPGGRIEATDATPIHAARRELAEETGVDAPFERFELIGHKESATTTLDVCFCVADLGAARTVEDELVAVVDIDGALERAATAGDQTCAHDFRELVESVLPRLHSMRANKRSNRPRM